MKISLLNLLQHCLLSALEFSENAASFSSLPVAALFVAVCASLCQQLQICLYVSMLTATRHYSLQVWLISA